MNRRIAPPLVLIALAATSPVSVARAADEVRINQVQVIGTHNSYHVAPDPAVLKLIAAASRRQAEALDYSHRPLAEQFSTLGIRQVELDVFADPAGGHYAEPSARAILRKAGQEPGPDPDAGGVLRKPGLKVFHVQDVDYRTTASTFADALRQVRDWSATHPRHVPILVLVELKDEAIPALPTKPVPFTAAALEEVDAAIRSEFSPATTIAPDEVRGASATLPEAIKSRGWPTLEASRGKVIFALDNGGRLRDLYLAGHPALKGRSMFVDVPAGDPAAAWMKRNDPVGEFDEITRLVRDGYLVRTRADADTAEARRDDPSRREKAFASGAQFVSTDYPEPRPTFSGYSCRLPGGVVARPNPVVGDSSRPVADPESPLPR